MQLTPPQPPQDDDVEALRIGLTGYNVSQAGPQLYELRRERIASFIKDKEGKIHGGIIADIKWGWLHVDWLWIDESIRRDGWGGRLLGAMEQYAQSKGITNYHLETTSFQALPFYQKQGYEVFGQLPDMPPGHISYFLKKQGK
ncbi:GNAT family N-acetyltransferase [Aeromonas veronii]